MFHAVMVELADTIDLGSIGATRTGSSPANRIKPIVIPAMGFLLSQRIIERFDGAVILISHAMAVQPLHDFLHLCCHWHW